MDTLQFFFIAWITNLGVSLDGLRIFKQTNQRVPSIIEFIQLHLSCLSQDDYR